MNATAIDAGTAELLREIRDGDRDAEQRLYERCLPALRRWAHGRMPRAVRDISDADDFVQATLLRALRHPHEFESSGSGSFLAYLRHILLNEVRTQLRRHRRRDDRADVDACPPEGDDDSVIGNLVGRDRLRAYEEALAALERRQQELVVMRLEFSMSYAEIALETGTSPDAVRMSLTRALKAMTLHIAVAQAG